MTLHFAIGHELQCQLLAHARAADPNECCGLIEGVRRENTIEVLALHPARNLSREPDRFEIDPKDHIGLLKTLRGTGREIVGCYHSHPGASAEPSARDLDGAADDDFLWLIVGRNGEIGAYIFESGRFRSVALS